MLVLQDRPRALPQVGSGSGEPRSSHWLSPSALIRATCGPGSDGSPASGGLAGAGGSAPAAPPALPSRTPATRNVRNAVIDLRAAMRVDSRAPTVRHYRPVTRGMSSLWCRLQPALPSGRVKPKPTPQFNSTSDGPLAQRLQVLQRPSRPDTDTAEVYRDGAARANRRAQNSLADNRRADSRRGEDPLADQARL